MSNNNDGKLHKKELFRVQALLQNTDVGVAKDVRLNFDAPANMFIVAGENHQIFPSLQPNEQKLIEFEFQTNANVADELDLEIRLAESYGRYAQNAHIPLRFGQAVSTGMTSLHIQGKAEPTVSITRGSLVSDIDENIPTAKKSDDDTYVLIIANENYKYVPNNPFALHDGQVFRQYCEQALGITGKNHINTCFDATLGDMMKGLRWLSDRMETNDKARAIVYYNGHGIPDEATRSAYLLPQDGENAMTRTAYSLDSLYSELGRMNRPVTVFLDACFSGSKRDGGSIGQAKAVAVVPKAGTPQGKTVVFSAATGDQTAGFFYEQQHGMFTYWLLKKLQESKGDVTFEQLGNYLYQNVRQSSFDENNKTQTPTVMNGSDAVDWKSWRLK